MGSLVVVALLGFPGVVASRAEGQAGSWILPSSAYLSGTNGAEYRTDVRLLNLGTASVNVVGTFHDQSNGQTYTSITFAVAARNQASYDNVLRALFGREPGAYGPIRFQSTGPIVVSSSVNNVNACGSGSTAGQWLPGIDASRGLKAGALGQLAVSANTGSGYRTNVVFMNPGGTSTTVRANLRRGGGALVGTQVIGSLAANGFRQLALSSFPGVSGISADTNLWLDFTSDKPILAFASVIHNGSGDPFAIVATADVAGGNGESEITVTLPGGVPLVMARIPAGTFQMGSPLIEKGRANDEVLHQVTLTSNYYVGKYELTQGQWVAVMGTNPSSFRLCGDGCPVDYVTWDGITGAGGFLEKLNAHLSSTGQEGAGKYRLPTEAEWERAVRGGTQTRFSFGDALDGDDLCGASVQAEPHVWWCANAESKTHPVGNKQANGYGLHDVHGNVAEWCQDWSGSLSSSAQTDPTGPATGTNRVVRGGDWYNDLKKARSADRHSARPGAHGSGIGFRLARSQ